MNFRQIHDGTTGEYENYFQTMDSKQLWDLHQETRKKCELVNMGPECGIGVFAKETIKKSSILIYSGILILNNFYETNKLNAKIKEYTLSVKTTESGEIL